MASYTIEDIELIRRKSGVSYQEAVALLDYHNGNVARALIDLERNGRIKADIGAKEPQTNAKNKSGFARVIEKLYALRVKVTKGDVSIVNLSGLFVGAAFLVSPWTVIGAAVLSAVLGYKISYTKDDPQFHASSEQLEQTVRNAAQNVRSTADDLARTVRATVDEVRNEKANMKQPAAEAPAAELDHSYYAGNPASTTYHATYTGGSVPTIQVPVKVESTDGDVSVNIEDDGHHSATIG